MSNKATDIYYTWKKSPLPKQKGGLELFQHLNTNLWVLKNSVGGFGFLITDTISKLESDYKNIVSEWKTKLKNKENEIIINAEDEYKLNQINDSLKVFATKRGVDVKSLDFQKAESATGNSFRQTVKLKNGIDQDNAKKIIKEIQVIDNDKSFVFKEKVSALYLEDFEEMMAHCDIYLLDIFGDYK